MVYLKRNLVALFWSLKFIKLYISKQYYDSCRYIAKIDSLNTVLAIRLSTFFYNYTSGKHQSQLSSKKINKILSDHPVLRGEVNIFLEKNKNFIHTNLIILKSFINEEEKGVLLIKYTNLINKFPFFFDLKVVSKKYDIILEPSTESPFQPYFFLFGGLDSTVAVQCLGERERKVARDRKLRILNICAGDWVDESVFYPQKIEKQYHFCIVSNFIDVKRYPFVLSALKKYWKGPLRVAIIASKWVGRSREWFETLVKNNNLNGRFDVFMEIPQSEVNKIINQSYCYVLSSVREGANKASFESILTNTPVIVYHQHKGFPLERFSEPYVLTYSDKKSLIRRIRETISIHKSTDASSKVQRPLIGSIRSSEYLNSYLRQLALSSGKKWTVDIVKKVNVVQCKYGEEVNAEIFRKDFEELKRACIVKTFYSPKEAISLLTSNQK